MLVLGRMARAAASGSTLKNILNMATSTIYTHMLTGQFEIGYVMVESCGKPGAGRVA